MTAKRASGIIARATRFEGGDQAQIGKLSPPFSLRQKRERRTISHRDHDDKSTGSDTNGQGPSKPSDGQALGRTPQGGGQGNNSGGRDSSQPGGQND
jgi:hypothetical protein